MSAIYLCVRITLALLHSLLSWRAAGAERHFEGLTAEAETLAGKDCSGTDRLQQARHQMRLSAVAARQERAEDRAVRFVSAAEAVGRWRAGLASWKGRTVPYLAGHLDVLAGMAAAEFSGRGLGWVIETVQAFVGR